MSETKPSVAIASSTRKPVFKSRTVLANLLIALAAFFPAVQSWIAGHPQEFCSLLVGVNILLRLVTDTRVALFPDGKAGLGMGLLLWGGTAAALMTTLPSCQSLSEIPITGSLSWRDPNSGAKAALTVGNKASRYAAPKASPVHSDK